MDDSAFRAASARPRRALRRCAPILGAVALSIAIAGPASATTTVGGGTITSPILESDLPNDCRPGITGTLVGSDVFHYHQVQTAQGYHLEATETSSGRITWSDGTYSLIESVDHSAFNAGSRTTIFAVAHEDSGNDYTVAGVLVSRVTFHEVEHVTVTDGVVQVSFDRGQVHHFGSC